jgi:hypothetical protein
MPPHARMAVSPYACSTGRRIGGSGVGRPATETVVWEEAQRHLAGRAQEKEEAAAAAAAAGVVVEKEVSGSCEVENISVVWSEACFSL